MPRTIQRRHAGLLAGTASLVMIAADREESTMDATALLKDFATAVERRDGKSFAGLFTEDGVYHDVFYGAFKGREKIAEMIDDWFHRTARDFRWEMFRPVSDGTMLYAYYTFSYVSTLPEAQGQARRLRRRVDHAAQATARSPSTARSPIRRSACSTSASRRSASRRSSPRKPHRSRPGRSGHATPPNLLSCIRGRRLGGGKRPRCRAPFRS